MMATVCEFLNELNVDYVRQIREKWEGPRTYAAHTLTPKKITH